MVISLIVEYRPRQKFGIVYLGEDIFVVLPRKVKELTLILYMEEEKDLKLPDEDEVLGIVESMLGDNRLKVRCADGETRTARIPGKMRKRVWVGEGDVVIIEPWEWQDERGEVKHRYSEAEADKLRHEGYLEI